MTRADHDSKPVRIDFGFRRRLAEKIEGNRVAYCYQCGACVGDCPAAAYSEAFNPRRIMLQVLYGLGDELLGEDSPLWLCTNCYNCHERCPQDVKPVATPTVTRSAPAASTSVAIAAAVVIG